MACTFFTVRVRTWMDASMQNYIFFHLVSEKKLWLFCLPAAWLPRGCDNCVSRASLLYTTGWLVTAFWPKILVASAFQLSRMSKML